MGSDGNVGPNFPLLVWSPSLRKRPLLKFSIDINRTELRLVVKITKQNGSPTGDGTKYIPVNNTLHSIIKQFTIKINETLVTEQSGTQAYNTCIKTLLNFTEQAKKLYLTKTLYYKATSGHINEVDNTEESNESLSRRATFTTTGAEVGFSRSTPLRRV